MIQLTSHTGDEQGHSDADRRGRTRRAFLRRTLLLASAGTVLPGLLAACTQPPAAAPAATQPPAKPAAVEPTKPAAAPAPTQAAAAKPTEAPKPAATAPAKAEPKALPRITSAGITTGVSGLIYQALQTFKFDEKNGFKLETRAMENQQAGMAVPLGVTDIGVVTVPEVARVNLEGHAVRVVAPMYWMHVFLMVKADAPYRDWHELKGKRVQSPGQASGSQNTLQVIAAMDGLDWNKDFNVTFIPALPAAVASLDRGEVDAIQIWPPLGATLVAGGKYRQLASVNEEWKKRAGGDLVNGAMGMLQSWYEKNRDVAKAANNALAETNKYLIENDAAWEHADILKVLGVTTQDLPIVRPAIRAVIAKGTWDDATLKSAELMVTKMAETGIIPSKPKDNILLQIPA